MYTVKRFNILTFEWDYMNMYNSYSEAQEAREWMEKRYGGTFEIFPVED